jgi:hypothetical protein
MHIMQVSVILDNVPGTLTRLVDLLDKEDIHVKAITAASISEDSTVRFVVNDPQRAAAVLSSFNFKNSLAPVLAAEVPLHAGGLIAILKPLAKGEINIHYLYTTIDRIGQETIVIVGVDKIEEAKKILHENWINLIGDEIYSL